MHKENLHTRKKKKASVSTVIKLAAHMAQQNFPDSQLFGSMP